MIDQGTHPSQSPPVKHLSELISGLPGAAPALVEDPLVSGIAFDSRQIQPGSLFVALTGGTTDGHRYIPDALRRGA